MIDVKCDNCGVKFAVKDEYAGRSGKCKNCGSTMTVPAAGGPPHATSATVAPAQVTIQQQPSSAQAPAAPTTVVVQIQQPQVDTSGMVGPKNVSTIGIIFWGLFWPGAQYQFLRQWGKMIVFSLISMVMWGLVVFTCGLGLFIFLPYALILLVDGLVVAGRIRQGPISPWRFF